MCPPFQQVPGAHQPDTVVASHVGKTLLCTNHTQGSLARSLRSWGSNFPQLCCFMTTTVSPQTALPSWQGTALMSYALYQLMSPCQEVKHGNAKGKSIFAGSLHLFVSCLSLLPDSSAQKSGKSLFGGCSPAIVFKIDGPIFHYVIHFWI